MTPAKSAFGPPSAMSRVFVLGAALVLLTVLVYAGALRGDFLWDDDSHVTENPVIVGPLGLKEIWTTSAANYFPLVLTNFWIQHALWGLNPLGYHVVTLLFHIGAAMLLWQVLAMLRVPGAWFGAALWALHPVQVESVAWISELKNTQSAGFFLLAIACYVRWLQSDSTSRRHYIGALAAAVCAVLSKPSTVMLPVVLVMVQVWRRHAWRWRDAIWLMPFFLLSAIAAGWAIWEQRHHSGAFGAEWELGRLERTAIAARSVWFYLGKLAWPHPLIFIYPRWEGGLELMPLVAAVGALGAVAGLGWYRRGEWGFGLLLAAAFFVALLFPVLGFFDVYFFRYSFVSDHFQYLASMGPLAAAAAIVARLPRWRATVTAVLLAGCGILARQHAGTFANNETLWRTTLAWNPAAPMAWLNLGSTLAQQQRHTEAISCFERVAALRPTDPETQNDTGWALNEAGYSAQAIPFLQRAVELKPTLASAQKNLGNALRKLGRRDEAMVHYLRAIELEPGSAEAHNNVGSALAEAGRTAEALGAFERAVRLAPKFVPAQANLGTALGLAGRWPEAVVALRETLRLDPNYPDAQAKLGVVLANTGQMEEALSHFQAALRLAPDAADVRRNYAAVLEALGRSTEASEHLTRAGSPPVIR